MIQCDVCGRWLDRRNYRCPECGAELDIDPEMERLQVWEQVTTADITGEYDVDEVIEDIIIEGYEVEE